MWECGSLIRKGQANGSVAVAHPSTRVLRGCGVPPGWDGASQTVWVPWLVAAGPGMKAVLTPRRSGSGDSLQRTQVSFGAGGTRPGLGARGRGLAAGAPAWHGQGCGRSKAPSASLRGCRGHVRGHLSRGKTPSRAGCHGGSWHGMGFAPWVPIPIGGTAPNPVILERSPAGKGFNSPQPFPPLAASQDRAPRVMCPRRLPVGIAIVGTLPRRPR